MTHARADIEQDAERERCVRTYKLSGPSPKPFRKRPTVEIDGRTIRDVIPNGRDPRDGCVVVLSNGARVRVTAYPSTVTQHVAEVAERTQVPTAQSPVEQTRQPLMEQQPSSPEGQERARVVIDADGRAWRLVRDVRGGYTVQHAQAAQRAVIWRTWPGLTVERARVIVDLAERPTVIASHDERVLGAIKACLEGRVTADLNLYAIGGRSLAKMTPDELFKWWPIYERKVWSQLFLDSEREKP